MILMSMSLAANVQSVTTQILIWLRSKHSRLIQKPVGDLAQQVAGKQSRDEYGKTSSDFATDVGQALTCLRMMLL